LLGEDICYTYSILFDQIPTITFVVTWYFHENDRFPGSILQVMGLSTVGEWAIVGGIGELTLARGVIKYETVLNVPNQEYYQKLSIYALYTPPSVSKQ
jgi:hypothetical protein